MSKNKKPQKSPATQAPTPEQIEAKQNEIAATYINGVVQLTGMQGLIELNYVKKIFVTAEGGTYLLQFIHLDGPPINCSKKA